MSSVLATSAEADRGFARTRFALVAGEFFVNLSRGAMTLSLGYFLYRLTGSVWAFALACLADLGIALTLRRPSGRLVEAHSARPVLMLAGAALGAVLCLVSLAGDLYRYSVWLALGVALTLGVIRVFQSAAGYAAVVQYASHRVESTNSLINIALQSGQLVGVLVAGVTLEVLSLNALCLITGLSYACATLCYTLLPLMGDKASPRMESAAAAPAASATQTAPTPTPTHAAIPLRLRLYAVLASLDFALVGIFNLILAPAVAVAFAGAPRWMSILDVNFAIGAIATGLLLVRFTRWCRAGRWWIPSTLSAVSGLLCFAAMFHIKGVPLHLAVLLFGFASTSSYMFWTSVSQTDTPAALSGRVGAYKSVCNSLALAVISVVLTATTVVDQGMLLGAAVGMAALSILIVISIQANFKSID